MHYRRPFIFVLFCLFLSLASQSFCFASTNDFQYWNHESIIWKVAQDWNLVFEQEFYFQDDASELYYQHSDLGIMYSGLIKWVDLGLNFRHILSKDKDDWKRTETPHFNINIKWVLVGFSMSDRSRFEYRFKECGDNSWRYRNKYMVKTPWKWTVFEIQPFLEDEFFVDFDQKELNENRLCTGFTFKILEHLSADIFHIWRRIKSSGKWAINDVLGSRLKLAF